MPKRRTRALAGGSIWATQEVRCPPSLARSSFEDQSDPTPTSLYTQTYQIRQESAANRGPASDGRDVAAYEGTTAHRTRGREKVAMRSLSLTAFILLRWPQACGPLPVRRSPRRATRRRAHVVHGGLHRAHVRLRRVGFVRSGGVCLQWVSLLSVAIRRRDREFGLAEDRDSHVRGPGLLHRLVDGVGRRGRQGHI